MLSPKRVTAPTLYPVSMNEVRLAVRVDDPVEDALLSTWIAAATSYLDGYSGVLGRCLLTQTWAVSFRYFPGHVIRLPFPDVASAAVTYFDTDDVEQTVASANHSLHDDARGSYLRLVPNFAFPATADRDDAVTVTFTAGYGNPGDVPEAIRSAILIMVARMYDDRGASEPVRGAGSDAVKNLIAPFRR